MRIRSNKTTLKKKHKKKAFVKYERFSNHNSLARLAKLTVGRLQSCYKLKPYYKYRPFFFKNKHKLTANLINLRTLYK